MKLILHSIFIMFFIIIVVESLITKNYNRKDSFQTFLFFSIFSIFYNLLTIPLLEFLTPYYTIRFSQLNFITLLSATIIFDFLYYWLHRLEHTVKYLWFFHIHHHSSRYMNFFTGFRASYTQPIYMFIILWPLILIGFSSEVIIFAITMNKIFNFWIHQKYFKKFPILDFFMNTPSNHRVHHGRNAIYIDKNFGGILIIWDKLFNTYEPESIDVDFGVSVDPEKLNLEELFKMGKN